MDCEYLVGQSPPSFILTSNISFCENQKLLLWALASLSNPVTKSLTGVDCRATSVARKIVVDFFRIMFEIPEIGEKRFWNLCLVS